MKLLIAALALSLSYGAIAAEPFSYKGVRLGDSIDLVKEKLPTYRCNQNSCEYSMAICVGATTREACDASASIGGVWIKNGFIKLRDSQVSEVILLIKTDLAQTTAEAIVQAYGLPVSTENKEARTKAGGVLPSWEKTWQSGEQTLVVKKIFSDINTSGVIISSASSKRQEEESRKEKALKGAKDF